MIHLQTLLRFIHMMEVHQYKLNELHTNGWFTNYQFIGLNSCRWFTSEFVNMFTSLYIVYQKTWSRFTYLLVVHKQTMLWFKHEWMVRQQLCLKVYKPKHQFNSNFVSRFTQILVVWQFILPMFTYLAVRIKINDLHTNGWLNNYQFIELHTNWSFT